MARKKLADLVKEEAPQEEAAQVTESDQPIRGAPQAVSPGAGPRVGTYAESGVPRLAPWATTPKYLTLQRKEARLRDDQVLALSGLSRRMNREKREKVERITENTLIRVAVDLLLARQGELRGNTEDELRAALGLYETG